MKKLPLLYVAVLIIGLTFGLYMSPAVEAQNAVSMQQCRLLQNRVNNNTASYADCLRYNRVCSNLISEDDFPPATCVRSTSPNAASPQPAPTPPPPGPSANLLLLLHLQQSPVIDSASTPNTIRGSNTLQFRASQVGNGGHFSGDDYIQVAHARRLNIPENYSLQVWLKPTTQGGYRGVWSNGNGREYVQHIALDPNNRPAIYTNASGWKVAQNANAIISGDTGALLTVTFGQCNSQGRNCTVKFYRDSTKVGEFNNVERGLPYTTHIRIGAWSSANPQAGPTYPFRGEMDEVAFYSGILTESQIHTMSEAIKDRNARWNPFEPITLEAPAATATTNVGTFRRVNPKLKVEFTSPRSQEFANAASYVEVGKVKFTATDDSFKIDSLNLGSFTTFANAKSPVTSFALFDGNQLLAREIASDAEMPNILLKANLVNKNIVVPAGRSKELTVLATYVDISAQGFVKALLPTDIPSNWCLDSDDGTYEVGELIWVDRTPGTTMCDLPLGGLLEQRQSNGYGNEPISLFLPTSQSDLTTYYGRSPAFRLSGQQLPFAQTQTYIQTVGYYDLNNDGDFSCEDNRGSTRVALRCEPLVSAKNSAPTSILSVPSTKYEIILDRQHYSASANAFRINGTTTTITPQGPYYVGIHWSEFKAVGQTTGTTIDIGRTIGGASLAPRGLEVNFIPKSGWTAVLHGMRNINATTQSNTSNNGGNTPGMLPTDANRDIPISALVYLNLDETNAGTYQDSSNGNPRHPGTCTNCPRPHAAGVRNGGAYFNRSQGQSIAVQNLDFGALSELTFEALINLNSYITESSVNASTILTKEQSNSGSSECSAPWFVANFSVSSNASDAVRAQDVARYSVAGPYSRKKLQFTVTINGRNYGVESPQDIQLNRWYHVVGTWHNRTIRLYINGVLVDTETINLANNVTPRLTETGSQLTVGSRLTCGTPQWQTFDGAIDEVGVYGRAFADSEVRDRYQGFAPNFTRP